MNNTLKTLSTIITPQHAHMSIEQLAAVYTEGNNPSVLAAAFRCVFDLANSIAGNYYGLSSEDIASFTLETLDKCLRQYDVEKGAFSTIFTIMLKSKLRTETQALNTHKRKTALTSCSLEDLMEASNFDIEAIDPESIELFVDVLSSYDLTPLEMEYCKLLMIGDVNKSIAEKLGVSVMTLCNMRKRLRVKIAPLMTL